MTQDDKELLIRVDERTGSLVEKFDTLNDKFDSFERRFSDYHVVRRIVFSAAGFILLSVLAGIIYLVVRA